MRKANTAAAISSIPHLPSKQQHPHVPMKLASILNLHSNADSWIQDDNDDYCSACGGNGDLVCCDGCTRSFHFKCIDPPMIEGALPESSWFCNICESRSKPQVLEDAVGSFGVLLSHLQRKNPSAFHLPKHVREYFENVKTGTEGEYEEAAQPKAK